ncbi:hypothetical protein PIB30_024801 [Stylosanthes scabra]|uniref:Uncharacterized protein n=1 Tax=Stylosanthes scabra TaxID=79078 RepID=A0ABU6WDD2_9FABA|nr:hypothetical protein [Stylosanthes scabra]
MIQSIDPRTVVSNNFIGQSLTFPDWEALNSQSAGGHDPYLRVAVDKPSFVVPAGAARCYEAKEEGRYRQHRATLLLRTDLADAELKKNKLRESRNLDAVAAHDKNKLWKVTEWVVPQSAKHMKEIHC